jgi:hypothetical protein
VTEIVGVLFGLFFLKKWLSLTLATAIPMPCTATISPLGAELTHQSYEGFVSRNQRDASVYQRRMDSSRSAIRLIVD